MIYADSLDDCNSVIAFYATSLAQFVGPSYRPPSLAFLARCWLESSSRKSSWSPLLCSNIAHCSDELRQASRVLIDARITRLSDEEANLLADRWQHYRSSLSLAFKPFDLLVSFVVPCLQPDAERESTRAALALFLCGYIATEKYSLFSTRY